MFLLIWIFLAVCNDAYKGRGDKGCKILWGIVRLLTKSTDAAGKYCVRMKNHLQSPPQLPNIGNQSSIVIIYYFILNRILFNFKIASCDSIKYKYDSTCINEIINYTTNLIGCLPFLLFIQTTELQTH